MILLITCVSLCSVDQRLLVSMVAFRSVGTVVSNALAKIMARQVEAAKITAARITAAKITIVVHRGSNKLATRADLNCHPYIYEANIAARDPS